MSRENLAILNTKRKVTVPQWIFLELKNYYCWSL